MKSFVLLLVLPNLVVQEKTSQSEIRTLIDMLWSESIDERDFAASELLSRGKNALAELRKAYEKASGNLDFSLRLRDLLRRITVKLFPFPASAVVRIELEDKFLVALKEIPEKDRPIVIMITANRDRDQLIKAVKLGIQGFFLKPVRPKEILEKLESLKVA